MTGASPYIPDSLRTKFCGTQNVYHKILCAVHKILWYAKCVPQNFVRKSRHLIGRELHTEKICVLATIEHLPKSTVNHKNTLRHHTIGLNQCNKIKYRGLCIKTPSAAAVVYRFYDISTFRGVRPLLRRTSYMRTVSGC